MSSADVDRAAIAVRKSVEPFGMVVDPRLQEIARESRASSSSDNEVVDLLTAGPDRSEFVEVRSVVEKSTGGFRVIIRDHELPSASRLTRELENAVVAALRDEFPGSEVLVDGGTTGPNLGP